MDKPIRVTVAYADGSVVIFDGPGPGLPFSLLSPLNQWAKQRYTYLTMDEAFENQKTESQTEQFKF